jgi:hypothetical protein
LEELKCQRLQLMLGRMCINSLRRSITPSITFSMGNSSRSNLWNSSFNNPQTCGLILKKTSNKKSVTDDVEPEVPVEILLQCI